MAISRDWSEDDGTNFEVRMARIEPEFAAATALATESGAHLQADARTYGLPSTKPDAKS